MTNHVHLIAVPATDDGLQQTLKPLHMRQRLNRQRQWSGHVWQGRFFSSPLDDAYLWTALRYVECNPVRAGMAERAQDYRWSSAATHCGLRPDALIKAESPWQQQLAAVADWSKGKRGRYPFHGAGLGLFVARGKGDAALFT